MAAVAALSYDGCTHRATNFFDCGPDGDRLPGGADSTLNVFQAISCHQQDGAFIAPDDSCVQGLSDARSAGYACWLAKDARFAGEQWNRLQNGLVRDSDKCAAGVSDGPHALGEVAGMAYGDGVGKRIRFAGSEPGMIPPCSEKRRASFRLDAENARKAGKKA
jgi:hypothetical protein